MDVRGTSRSFTLHELSEGTSNWAHSNILGDGGFAVVYLGKLGVVGRVAIKKVRSPDNTKERDFLRQSILAELKTMNRYKHQNICDLIGSYVDPQNPDASYCLVYELCENGCLLERLACRDHTRKSVPALTAQQRLVIALGTCRALEFLHVKALPPIVHRDVKSANILLDSNFEAKLADFGTVRQDKLEADHTHIKTENVIGTRCYMPPEYMSGGEVSVKTDSYAVGVVICEILTGLNPMAKPLVQLVEGALEDEELETILDAKIVWEDRDLAKQLADIAVRCSRGRKEKRATVQEVLPELERLRNPNYMPTLAVGNTYYHPDTGLLTQHSGSDDDDGSDDERRMGAETVTAETVTPPSDHRRVVHVHPPPALAGGADSGTDSGLESASEKRVTRLREPLLMKNGDGGSGDGAAAAAAAAAGPTCSIRIRWWVVLAAFVIGIVGVAVGMLLSHHSHPHPTPVPTGGCIGASTALCKQDCDVWQQKVLPSRYFAEANPPACNEPHHKNDPCSCTGVIGCSNGRIVSVNLEDRGLAFNASTDDSLCFLQLQFLSLRNCADAGGQTESNLVGRIPSWLENMSATLRTLHLECNLFTGKIDPVLPKLTSLQHLRLDVNKLTGPLDSLGTLTSLSEYLGLNRNDFSPGTLDSLTALTSLQILCAENVNLFGSLEPLAKLTNLTVLAVGNVGGRGNYNRLHGTLAPLTALVSLTDLVLCQNDFSGPIDPLYEMHSLTRLNLRGNSLNGTLGAGLATRNMPNLTDLDLSTNGFTAVDTAINWTRFKRRCNLQHEKFTCSADSPLPHAAKVHCGATCCVGMSADLRGEDCDVWQQKVLPSRYFAEANPPACNEPRHKKDPCSCTGVIGCSNGRIVSMNFRYHNLGRAFNLTEDASLSYLNGLTSLTLTANHFRGTLPPWLRTLGSSLKTLLLDSNDLRGPVDVLQHLPMLTSLVSIYRLLMNKVVNLYRFSTDSLHILYTFSIHSLHILYTFSTHSLHILYTFSTHSLYILYTFSIHLDTFSIQSLYILYTFSVHSLYTFSNVCLPLSTLSTRT
jgi:serine/threonine protein kinase/Leucine-rich repeat (LRR) protein